MQLPLKKRERDTKVHVNYFCTNLWYKSAMIVVFYIFFFICKIILQMYRVLNILKIEPYICLYYLFL